MTWCNTKAMPLDLQLRFPVSVLQIRVSQLCYWHSGVQRAHVPVSHPWWWDGPGCVSAGCCPVHVIYGRMPAHTYIWHRAGSCLWFQPSAHLHTPVLGLRERRALLQVDSWVEPSMCRWILLLSRGVKLIISPRLSLLMGLWSTKLVFLLFLWIVCLSWVVRVKLTLRILLHNMSTILCPSDFVLRLLLLNFGPLMIHRPCELMLSGLLLYSCIARFGRCKYSLLLAVLSQNMFFPPFSDPFHISLPPSLPSSLPQSLWIPVFWVFSSTLPPTFWTTVLPVHVFMSSSMYIIYAHFSSANLWRQNCFPTLQ